ncbi:AIDA repeat-containing protein, partial [Escherichia coli]
MNRTSPYYFRRSVLSLLISALIYAQPGMAAFTTNVIGVVNDETVDGNQRVDERGTTNNTHIINHGRQEVYGGISNSSIIETGGEQLVSIHADINGQANNTTINGGRQSIEYGGISTGTIIESGNQYVYKGGTSNDTTIKGGTSRIEGGTANGTIIDGGGQSVSTQGHVDGTTINKSGYQDITQGSLATNTTINGGRQYVEQSTVETTAIKNGGEQRVYESRALDTTIEGGTQSLNSKSTAKNTQIYSGGTQIVDNTSSSDVIEVYSGGVLDVRGGTATNITQHDGAALKVTTYDLTVSGTNSEGAFSIHNNVAENVLLENGGHLDINAYGSANKTIIKDKGTMSVLTNAKADATRIDNGGVMDVAGNATNTIINGGTQNINNHGIATGTNINSGTQNIKSGGKADTTNISSGSRQVVEKDGTATGSNISAGGSLIVYTGGIAHGVNQETGSALVANTGAGTDIEGYNKLSHFTITGGEANYVVLENTGELTVMAKTSAKNTTIDAGGKLIVQKEAKTDSTRLNNGGVLEVQDGGEAKHVEQQSGGALIASTTSGTLIEGTNSYGDAFYIRNSEAKNVVLENAGSLTVVTGSRAVDTIINANGKMDVYGKDVGTVLNSAGTQTIYASATSEKANIKGGKQTVYGLATEANIESGEQIVDGGSTDKTHINGGTQTVQNYGKAINTDIVSGLQQIMVNGTAEGSIINGGSQVVNEGGLAENSVLNEGGTLDVREKGSATGIQQSSQGALVATTRATRVTGTRADGVAFSIEQDAANNILLADGGVLTVESDTTSAKTQVNAGGREIVKTKATATGTTLTGGEQIVEGVANETTINEGGTLTVNDNGKATDIIQNSGAALQTSTANGIEISGTHQYGTFSIAGNLATNVLLENGGNLLVLAGTEARDSTVGNGGAMQNLGQDFATKVNSGGQYTLGRSKDEFQALARAEDLLIAGGTAIVYAGTLADASVSGATGSLSLMTPRDNVTPVKLEGVVRITDSATLTIGNGVDTTLADLTAASRGSVWLNSNNSCAGTSNCEYRVNSLLLNDGDVYLSAQTAAPATTNGIYNTLTTSELSGSGNFYLHTNVAGSRGDQLVVNNNATGNFKIFVQDTGVSPQSDDAMTLVKTGGGDTSFTLGNTG